MTPDSWFKYFLFPIWIPKNSGSVISTHANTRSNLTNMAVKSTTLFHSIKSNYHTVQLLTIWKIHMSELHYIRLHPKLTVDDHIWDAQRDDNRLMSRGLEATGGMCSFRPFRPWQSRIESLNLLLVLTYFPCCISLLNPKKLLGLHGIATWLEGDKRVHGVQSVQPLGILLQHENDSRNKQSNDVTRCCVVMSAECVQRHASIRVPATGKFDPFAQPRAW